MIKVVGFRVLVKPDPIEKVTKAGIVIVEDERAQEASQYTGTVIDVGAIAWEAFGPNNKGQPWAQPGDRIIYSKYAGKKIKDPETDEQYVVINDDDVVAVVTGEKEDG